MTIGLPVDYFQTTVKPHVVTDIEMDEMVNAIHALEDDSSNKFDGSGGHKHTGSAGDAPNIEWTGIATSVKSSAIPPAIEDPDTGVVGVASKFAREDHNHAHADSNSDTGITDWIDLHHEKLHAYNDVAHHSGLLNEGKLAIGTEDDILITQSGTAEWASQSAIDHTEISNIGSNSHVQIDSHIAAGSPHSGHYKSGDSPSFVTVTATNYNFSPVKTTYHNIPGASFYPLRIGPEATASYDVRYLYGKAVNENATSKIYLVHGLILPHGVTITHIKVYGNDVEYLDLYRYPVNGDTEQTMSEITVIDNVTGGEDSSISFPTIDNQNYRYWFVTEIDNVNNAALWNVIITFTRSSLN
jgi:hypothetical protein